MKGIAITLSLLVIILLGAYIVFEKYIISESVDGVSGKKEVAISTNWKPNDFGYEISESSTKIRLFPELNTQISFGPTSRSVCRKDDGVWNTYRVKSVLNDTYEEKEDGCVLFGIDTETGEKFDERHFINQKKLEDGTDVDVAYSGALHQLSYNVVLTLGGVDYLFRNSVVTEGKDFNVVKRELTESLEKDALNFVSMQE